MVKQKYWISSFLNYLKLESLKKENYILRIMAEEDAKESNYHEALEERNLIKSCSDVFSQIFGRLGFFNFNDAALYYTLSIIKSPTSPANILDEAQGIYGPGVTKEKIDLAEAELIERKLFVPAISKETDSEKGSKPIYLPSDPLNIWNKNKKDLEDTYIRTQLNSFDGKIKKLHDKYKDKFIDMDHTTLKDCIELFRSIFRKMKFKHHFAASIYYTLLIAKFPTNFSKLLNAAINLYPEKEIKEKMLQEGREELLEKGLIAQIIAIYEETRDFGRETYVPTDPLLVWQEYETDANGEIQKLHNLYADSFGKRGVRAETGNITIRYSKDWIMYFLKKNVEGHDSVHLMLSKLDSLDNYKEYYKYMLDKNLDIQIIFDEEHGITNKTKKEFERDYPKKFKIKITPVHHTTSRKIIYKDLAVDGRKILSDTAKEPSYIGTIYLKKHIIKYIDIGFTNAWDACNPKSPQ